MTELFRFFFRDYTDCLARDKNHQKNSWQLITLYLDSTQDVFEHKNKQDLSESKLLGRTSVFTNYNDGNGNVELSSLWMKL